MIKKLNIKMLISMFILVITVFITSSCFAAETVVLNYADYISSNHLPSLPDVKNYLIENGYDISNTKILAAPDYEGGLNGINFWFIRCDENINLKLWYSSKADDFYRNYCFFVSNSDDDWNSRLTNYYAIEVLYIYNNPKGYYYAIFEHNGKDTTNATPTLCYSNKSLTLFDINEINTYDMDGNIIFDATKNYISASYEFQTDSSAKVKFALNKTLENYSLYYSLSGVEPNVSLTDPVKLRNPIQYYIGTSSLTVKPNSKVYYALYDSGGNCLEQDVLAVPAYDVVYENSDKDITYNLEYAEDYSYAILSAQIINKDFSDKLMWSSISMLNVSTGKLYGGQTYSNSLKLTDNGNYYLYAVDSLDNVFVSKVVNVDKIVNFSESDFSYEYYNETSEHNGYKLKYIPHIKTYSSQTYIDFKVELTSGYDLSYVSVISNWADKGYVDSSMGTFNASSKIFTGRVYSGDTIEIFSSFNKVEDLEGNITFIIKSKTTDEVLLKKTYTIAVNSYLPDNILTGGAGNDKDISTSTDSSSNNIINSFKDLDENSSIQDVMNTAKDGISVISTCFSILPGWIWVFVSVGIGICIILRILGR